MVSFVGLGSGIDTDQLVAELMTVERGPLRQLQRQESIYQAQLSAYGQMKNALSNFVGAMDGLDNINDFEVYQISNSNPQVLHATTDPSISAGHYEVTVLQRAMGHKVASASQIDAVSSLGVAGTVEIAMGSELFNITIDANNDSLTGIRDSINSELDNPGVRASIINADDGLGATVSYLILSAQQTGINQQLTLSDTSGNVASSLDFSTEIQTASDAKVLIDGFTISNPDNTFANTIEGLKFTISDVSPDPISLDVAVELDAVTDQGQKFVTAYNVMANTLNSIKRQEISSSSGNTQLLQGDNSVNFILNKFRQELSTKATVTGKYQLLTEVGVSSKGSIDLVDGYSDPLKFDQSEFSQALSNDFSGVAALFADSSEGYSVRLKAMAESFLNDDGILDAHSDGLEQQIINIGKGIERQQARLEIVEQRYLQEYAKMDETMGKLQSINSYLEQQLSTLSLANQSNSRK